MNKRASRLPVKQVKALFNRFAAIWGNEWNKRIEGNAKGALREWAEALYSYNALQIDKAVELARIKHSWAPKISEFESLCKNSEGGVLIKLPEAQEIAERKIRAKIIPKNYEDVTFQRDLIVALTMQIYKNQNENATVIICSSPNCKQHIFVEIGDAPNWLCNIHALSKENKSEEL